MFDPLQPPWTVAGLAPPPMGFSRQEYWSGLSFPPPGDLPNPESNLCLSCLLHWQEGSLPLAPLGKPIYIPYEAKFVNTHILAFKKKLGENAIIC